jgi:hypothetical protein
VYAFVKRSGGGAAMRKALEVAEQKRGEVAAGPVDRKPY